MAITDIVKRNVKKLARAAGLFAGNTGTLQAPHPKAKPVRPAEDSLYPPIIMTNETDTRQTAQTKPIVQPARPISRFITVPNLGNENPGANV